MSAQAADSPSVPTLVLSSGRGRRPFRRCAREALQRLCGGAERRIQAQRLAEVLLGDVVEIDLAGHYVVSELLGKRYQTAYDSLIVAAGADQSYFGNDHFAEFAPGMKTIDHALEVRGRILGAFELAEATSDSALRERLLTFTVVGGGPTGVELAGQIAELAAQTLKTVFRRIDSTHARVILLDAGTAVLTPMGAKLGKKAQARLQKMGVEIQLGARVVDVDIEGLTVKDSDGTTRRIESACKVWSAGVSASPLGAQLAEQAGAEIDRAGRVEVLPDLTIPGHPNVFVIGDMASVPGVPGSWISPTPLSETDSRTVKNGPSSTSTCRR